MNYEIHTRQGAKGKNKIGKC